MFTEQSGARRAVASAYGNKISVNGLKGGSYCRRSKLTALKWNQKQPLGLLAALQQERLMHLVR